MADIESWETKVLRDHTEMLEMALVPELLFVAHELNKAYLLSDTELEEIKAVPSLLTSDQKAGKIVSTVKRMVKLNSSNFEKFVDVLKKKPQIFETVINTLSTARSECSSSMSCQKEKVTGNYTEGDYNNYYEGRCTIG